MILTSGSWIIFCGCLIAIIIMPVAADLISPAITHVYFEKDGVPYNDSVQYSVKCYGYSMGYPYVTRSPGSYSPELIFSYSATCPGYGCEIYQPYYYLGHSDWCDLEGQAGNERFEIRNFSRYPYTRCDFVQERVKKEWGDTREYYYSTPEYSQCRQVTENLNEQWHASQVYYSDTDRSPNRTSVILLPGLKPLYQAPGYNSSVISRSDLSRNTSEYIAYLETCDPLADPACGGWIVNGKSLKSLTEYRPLLANVTDLQEHPCDRFLVKADPSLIMPFTDPDPWHHMCAEEACNYTMDLCESRFTIPAGTTMSRAELNATPAKEVPWTVLPRSYKSPESSPVSTLPSPQSPAMKLPGVPWSPVESLYCGIVQIFGGTCE